MWRFATPGSARVGRFQAAVHCRPRLPEKQPQRGKRVVTRSTHHPAQCALARMRPMFITLALGLTILATTVPAEASPISAAPLDTLELANGRKIPVASANLDISRKMLPEVQTTTVPRTAPPSIPPRLDDPARGERLFRAARVAARQGEVEQAETSIRAALTARPGDSRLPLWQVQQALNNLDLGGVVWHMPGAIRAILGDPLAIPRLAVQLHQSTVLMVATFWTLLLMAGYAAWWRSIAHDLSALIFRGTAHRLRLWTPWLLIIGVILMRPGWLGGLALLSVPVVLQARGKSRTLILATWLVALGLTFPNWPLLREAMPVLDPDSETMLLVRAGEGMSSSTMIKDLRERHAATEDPERQLRLRLVLGLQEARRGRFTSSTEHFNAVLAKRPGDVTAMVGIANNAYFTSHYDRALKGYLKARKLAPNRGEIPFNQAQVYFKKLFVPEAGQALEDARALGFNVPTLGERNVRQTDHSPVVYLGLQRHDLRASALGEVNNYPPQAALASWNYFLGTPPLPLFILLGGLLAMAVVLTYWGGLQDDVRHCDSCGNETCRTCSMEREGSLICSECNETADRSRSEMVLATLLKNRSRTVGLATTARLVRLSRLIPGSAHLAIGETGRALGRLSMLAIAVYLIAFGWAFEPSATWASPGLTLAEETVHPLWLPLPASAWPGIVGWPVLAGWIMLAAVFLVALIDGTKLRMRLPERLVHVHTNPVPDPGQG